MEMERDFWVSLNNQSHSLDSLRGIRKKERNMPLLYNFNSNIPFNIQALLVFFNV